MIFERTISHPMEHIVEMLSHQADQLGKARNEYLAKKAEKRNFESNLKQFSAGTSQAEKTMHAEATSEWLNFEKSLARLEAVFEFQKDKMDVLRAEYQAQYLSLKLDSEILKKQT